VTQKQNGNSLYCYGNEAVPVRLQDWQRFLLLDNFYTSGKSSAEGHSWADSALVVTDYVKKCSCMVWGYPHVLADALSI